MKSIRRMFSALLALVFLCTVAFGEAPAPVEEPAAEEAPQIEAAEAEPSEEAPEEAPAEAEPPEQTPAEEPAEDAPSEQIPVEEPTEEIPTEEPAEEPAEEAPTEEPVEEILEALPLEASADGFEIDGTTLTKYTGSDSDITIPEGVTKIGEKAFESCTSLRSVTIPEYITNIGNSAFLNCTNLQSVNMLCSLDEYAFGYYAFQGCTSLQSVQLPQDLKRLNSTFKGCTSLENIELPDSLIGMSSAFYDCSSLRSIRIPSGVKDISQCFHGCSSLQSVDVPNGVTEIYMGTFEDCSSLERVSLPETVTSIGYDAFSGCVKLTEIHLPDGLTTLQNRAFEDCTGLQSIQIPSKIMRVAGSTFHNCTNLRTVGLPDGLLAIESNAFQNCAALQAIDIPQGVTSIGSSAFDGCAALQGIQLPDGLTFIGSNAFKGCASLETVSIPANVSNFGGTEYDSYTWPVFQNCSKLREVSFLCALQSLPAESFKGCAALQSVRFESVQSIGNSAFSGCAALETVSFSGLQSIGDSAFENCDALTSIDFLDGVTSIGSGAFANCDGLRDVRIPGSVTMIGSENSYNALFAGCKNLNSLTIERGETPLHIYGSICSDSPLKTAAIEREIVNERSREASSFGSSEFIFYRLSDLTSITFSDDLTSLPDIFCNNCGFANIRLPAGLTAIPRWAFYDCDKLRTVEIPSQVATIGNYAFGNCDGLWKVDLPDKLATIGDYAFSNCEALEQINLPGSLTGIGAHAFDYCWGLTSLDLPGSLRSIGEYAFVNSGVTSFDIPSGITEIPEGAFSSPNRNPGALTSIKLPATLTSIGPKAFERAGLREIEIPGSVTSIGSRAFAESRLRSISLPAGVSVIESELFDGCEYLESIAVPGNISEIRDYAFQGCKNLTDAVLDEGVTTLGSGAFKDCGSMRTIQLPESLTSIDRYAFQNCGKLTAFVRAGSRAESYCQENNIPYNTGSIGAIEFTDVKDGDAIPGGVDYTLNWKAVSGADLYVAGYRILDESFGVSDWEEVEFEELTAASYTFNTYDIDFEVWISAYKTSGSGRVLLAEGRIHLCPDWNMNSIQFPGSLRLGVGESTTLTASSSQDSGFTYRSGDTRIATISSAGLVKALKAGTTYLTATGKDSGESASCELTVYALPTKLSFSPAKLDIGVGQSKPLALIITPEGAECELRFSSTAEGIASVDADGVVTGVSAGSATITAETDNGKSASCAITVKPAPTAVNFDPAELTLYEGRSATLKPVLTPTNSAAGFTYESDDISVARVDENGVVEAVGSGDAKITATAHNGAQGSCVVHVLPAPTQIEVERELTLGKGEKFTLNPTLGGEASAGFTFTSGKTAVASVSAAGKITARKAGEADITIASGNLTAICHVTVDTAPSKISLSEKKAMLGVGDVLSLEAILPAGSASTLTWNSSKGQIASVKDGLVTALQAGSTTISVKTFNGKKASCKLTVKAAPTSVAFEPAHIKLASGQEFQLKPVLDAGAAASFSYESTDAETASVDEDGILTAGKPGSATITATAHNGVSASCEIEVVPAPKTLSIAAITLGKGEKLDLQPVVDSGADSDLCPFTYSIKKASIAKLTADGKISGKAKGSTVLTVQTYNGLKAQCDVTVTPAPKSVGFSIKSVTMSPGCKLRLDAQFSGESSSQLRYESSDAGVATVSDDGTVTAIGPGTATIRATTYNNKKASFQVIVE